MNFHELAVQTYHEAKEAREKQRQEAIARRSIDTLEAFEEFSGLKADSVNDRIITSGEIKLRYSPDKLVPQAKNPPSV